MKKFGTLALTGLLCLTPSFSTPQSGLFDSVKKYLNPNGTVQEIYRVGEDALSMENIEVNKTGNEHEISFTMFIWKKYDLGGKELSAFYRIGRKAKPSEFGIEYTIDKIPSFYVFEGNYFPDEPADGINGNEKQKMGDNRPRNGNFDR